MNAKAQTSVALSGGLKKMNSKYIFPVALIVLNIGAAIMYGINGDVRKVIYWLAAAALNITVTFQKGKIV